MSFQTSFETVLTFDTEPDTTELAYVAEKLRTASEFYRREFRLSSDDVSTPLVLSVDRVTPKELEKVTEMQKLREPPPTPKAVEKLVKRICVDHDYCSADLYNAASALESQATRITELEERCVNYATQIKSRALRITTLEAQVAAFVEAGKKAEQNSFDYESSRGWMRAVSFSAYAALMATLRNAEGKQMANDKAIEAAAVDGDASEFKFKIGDPVSKISGYAFDGYVRSAFTVAAGNRYVVESEAAPGLLHIFNEAQLDNTKSKANGQ